MSEGLNVYLDQARALFESGIHAVQPLAELAVNQALAQPVHTFIELFFGATLVYFVFLAPVRRAKLSHDDKPTEAEQNELLRSWAAVPFGEVLPAIDSNVSEVCPFTIAHVSGPKVIVVDAKGRKSECLNVASYDHLGMSTNPVVVEAAKHAVRQYGVGSCGPRGFYGSIKPHLDLEANLAKFLGTHSAIIYSFQYATTSTMIPGFASRGDVVVVDDACNVVVQQGCQLCRAHVLKYRHNDMKHLEEVLKHYVDGEKKKGRKIFRRFVITEGVFMNTGAICDLRSVVELCKTYKFRIILDDSYGFGVLGATGRGTPEFLGVPIDDITIYSASLSTALGSVGGFCAGSNMVVDHQRLSATGYVFSASLPPYCSIAASAALEIIQAEPSRVATLQRNSEVFREALSDPAALPSSIRLVSSLQNRSPVCHFVHVHDARRMVRDSDSKFELVVRDLREKHRILVARSLYNSEETNSFPASLKVMIRGDLSEKTVRELAQAVANTLRQYFA